eukprot:gene7787-9630_t
MPDLILHHYPTSPFSEKVRLILGHKKLSWQSVNIPRIMPKPDVIALTGGYRRTPVLQIGADIYCDTALIARRLEAEKAVPALIPAGQEFNVASFCHWVDSVIFQHAVSLVFQPESIAVRFGKLPPEAIKAFIADRAGLFSGGTAARLPAEVAKALSRNGVAVYPQRSGEKQAATIAKLLHEVAAVPPSLNNNEVYEIFMAEPKLLIIPVVDDGVPLGLISRFDMIDHFARPYQ